MSTVSIRAMVRGDQEAVLAIYREGIATGHATFEAEAPPWQAWDAAHLPHSRRVAEVDGEVVGWAALAPVSERCVYGGVGEVSVYVAAAARGRGVGRALLAALVSSAEAEGVWTLQAGIFPENTASVAVHLRAGFRLVGVRERLGQLGGVWRDVALLERRSPVVGAPDVAEEPEDVVPDGPIKQVIVYRRDLKMRKGKIAAQVAHASLGAVLHGGDPSDAALATWLGGRSTKVVLAVDSEADLVRVHDEARLRGLRTVMVTDAGRTEFHGVPTRTAVAVGPADAAAIDAITGPEGLVPTRLA